MGPLPQMFGATMPSKTLCAREEMPLIVLEEECGTTCYQTQRFSQLRPTAASSHEHDSNAIYHDRKSTVVCILMVLNENLLKSIETVLNSKCLPECSPDFTSVHSSWCECPWCLVMPPLQAVGTSVVQGAVTENENDPQLQTCFLKINRFKKRVFTRLGED